MQKRSWVSSATGLAFSAFRYGDVAVSSAKACGETTWANSAYTRWWRTAGSGTVHDSAADRYSTPSRFQTGSR